MTAKLERAYFEDLYRLDDDPWRFETSEYEQEKYRRTLAALGDRCFPRALELGCSIGVFTQMLAPRCHELLGVDVSEQAVATARDRLTGTPGVRIERRELPEEMPAGTFDLVVAAEVLYYWDRDLLVGAIGALEAALAPGGSLLAVHWRPQTRTYPLLGDEVHDLLRGHLSGLDHAVTLTEEQYRLDRFDSPRGVEAGA